ncbi:MAG: hypothetical protein K2J79_06370, partial [Ruminiclostridium sp.]|nr:hypothetical protein [Ruminiclostridium sp.]
MIRSYKLFVSNTIIKKYLIVCAVVFCIVFLAGILNLNTSNEDLSSLLESIVPMLCCAMFPVTTLVSLASIYNANLKGEPYGYNYFHSLKNSDTHFRNAIIFGNIILAALILPFGAVMLTCFSAYNTLILLSFVLLASGMLNLFGFKQSLFVRILPLAALGGGIGAYFAATQDKKIEEFSILLVILAIVSAGVYLWGVFHAIIGAKSAWLRSGNERIKDKGESENKTAVIDKRAEKRMSKKRKQSSMGFLMSIVLRAPKLVLIFLILFSMAIEVLPFVFHENLGSEDYLFPKAALFFASMILTAITAIIILRDLLGNKLVHSLPISKKLCTRSIPTFTAFLILGLSIVFIGVYFVFLGSINAETAQYSDTLIMGAAICGSLLFFSSVLMQNFAGIIVLGYVASLPTIALILLSDDTVKQ